jgi:hypothetical protein
LLSFLKYRADQGKLEPKNLTQGFQFTYMTPLYCWPNQSTCHGHFGQNDRITNELLTRLHWQYRNAIL